LHHFAAADGRSLNYRSIILGTTGDHISMLIVGFNSQSITYISVT